MNKQIQEEIKDIAPTLLSIGNENPYSIPQEYFEGLQNTVDDRLNRRDDVDLSENPPDYYFDNLPQIILDRVGKTPSSILPIYYRRWIVAASVVIVGLAGIWKINTNNGILEEEQFAMEIDTEEVIEYLLLEEELYMSEVINFVEEDFFVEEENVELTIDEIELYLMNFDTEEIEELL